MNYLFYPSTFPIFPPPPLYFSIPLPPSRTPLAGPSATDTGTALALFPPPHSEPAITNRGEISNFRNIS